MSAKEEVEESRALVEFNGSASIINETGLQVYPVVKMTRAKLDDSFEAVTDLKRLASTRLFDIDFDSDMKERTTYSGTKMQPLLADSPIRAITCKADKVANNYKGVGLAIAGGSGILVVPVRDPLPSARGRELAPNGRAMVFMPMPHETLPLPLGATKTLYIVGFPSHSSRREGARIL
uniref:Uncharacterized protein n=1 Tax=Solanum tuberosum TaxID=4113 RepID=M1AUV7_SOLTU